MGGVGLVLSAILTVVAWRDAVARDRERMAALTEQLWQELETRVEGYEREISQLAEWFGERASVTDVEWENRVERMKLPVNFPAFTEVLFAETVRPSKAPEMPPGSSELDRLWAMNSSWAMIYRGWDFEVRQQVRCPFQPGKDGRIPELRFKLPERARRLVAELGSERLNHVSGTLSVRSSRRRFADVGPTRREAVFTLFAGAYHQSMVNMSAIDEPAFGRWHGRRNLTRLESLRGVVAGTVAVAIGFSGIPGRGVGLASTRPASPPDEFFESALRACGVHLLTEVVADWGDAEYVAVSKAIRKRARPRARLPDIQVMAFFAAGVRGGAAQPRISLRPGNRDRCRNLDARGDGGLTSCAANGGSRCLRGCASRSGVAELRRWAAWRALASHDAERFYFRREFRGLPISP